MCLGAKWSVFITIVALDLAYAGLSDYATRPLAVFERPIQASKDFAKHSIKQESKHDVVMAKPVTSRSTTISNYVIGKPLVGAAHTPTYSIAPGPLHYSPLESLTSAIHSNPLIAALLLGSILGISPAHHHQGFNSADLAAHNPYIALLLSHYGRYLPTGPRHLPAARIYSYAASNNVHNNLPFGSYKISVDST